MTNCPKCKKPMDCTIVKTGEKFCMPCAVKAAQATIARLHREELIPIAGWAWDTDDGWMASQRLPRPPIVGIPAKIMVARKYVGMDGRTDE